MSEPGGPGPLLVEVAVPLPLPAALVYEVPAALAAQAEIGRRARVRVGKRRLTGLIVGLPEEPPADVELRQIEAVVDEAVLLPEELLELGAWIADYYMAPPGEVYRTLIPPGHTPWGDRRIWLTDGGALARPRGEDEAAVVEALQGSGRMRLSELQASTELERLDEVVGRLHADGRIGLSRADRRGSRYRPAVELARGELEELLERAGRSMPGRQVVELLDALGRPATVDEVCRRVGCGKGVVRRLIDLGVLRSFSQIERLDLDQHLTAPREQPEIRLRPDQRQAVDAIRGAVDSGRFAGFLLAGVTGAGKTEVYLRVAASTLEAGRSTIILVPEIALVPVLARTLKDRFGARLAILHSNLTGPQRQQEWERVRRGEARVVLGPRSAVLAPVHDLGLLIVDEEQDSAYKQDVVPRYNGRDVALLRGRRNQAAVVVVSATPSLESRLNAATGKLEPLRLTERVGQGSLPEGILVDLRLDRSRGRPGEVHFSERLCAEIERSLTAGEQIILLRNRRGYAPILLCRACGEDLRCEECSLPRTLHKRDQRMLCHYCGSRRPVPERCVSCGEEALEPTGAGTERVEESFRELFPDVTVDVLDRDAVRRAGSVAAVLERFGRGDTRVLIGTQMVAKGHHFPEVGLTAVLQADTYLRFPDFRAVERTYALITQLAGRAGRGERPGRVVIQTLTPEHYAVRAALEHDDAAFAEQELRFRRVFHYPPYTRMIQLLVRERDRDRAESSIREIAHRVVRHPLAREVRISGPAPAPFERLRGRWRFQLLLRGPSGSRLRRLVREAALPGASTDPVIDVDPYELL